MNNKYKKSVINLVKASEDLDAMGYNSLSSKILRLAYRLHSHAQDLNPLSIPPAQPVYDPAEYTKTFQEMRTYITYAGMRLDEATKGTITMDESQLNARSDIKDLHSQVQSSINQETSDINVASGKIDNLFKK